MKLHVGSMMIQNGCSLQLCTPWRDNSKEAVVAIEAGAVK